MSRSHDAAARRRGERATARRRWARALRVAVAAGSLLVGTVALTSAALTDSERAQLGTDGTVGGSYDIALLDQAGTVVQADQTAHVIERIVGDTVPLVGAGPEPHVLIDVVTTTTVTGPVTIALGLVGSPTTTTDPASVALFTIAVDGTTVADHLTLAEVNASPVVVPDWEPGASREVTVAVAMPGALGDPFVRGLDLEFAVELDGASS